MKSWRTAHIEPQAPGKQWFGFYEEGQVRQRLTPELVVLTAVLMLTVENQSICVESDAVIWQRMLGQKVVFRYGQMK